MTVAQILQDTLTQEAASGGVSGLEMDRNMGVQTALQGTAYHEQKQKVDRLKGQASGQRATETSRGDGDMIMWGCRKPQIQVLCFSVIFCLLAT